MRTSTAGVVLSMLTVMAAGCAARVAQVNRASAQDPRPDCGADANVCSRPWLAAGLARGDVATWREYYTSVMEEAFRRNSAVIWVNPPKPIGNVSLAQGALPPTGLGQ